MRNLLGGTLARLGKAIVSGQHPPGSPVPPEPVLCQTYGVSRTVVREAVKSLVAKGLLVTGPKLGTRVLPHEHWNWFDPDLIAWQSEVGLSREFLRDLQDLRRVVEPAAARLAAERATTQDLAEIQAAYDGMAAAVADGGDYVSHDLRFHLGLLRASRNRMLMQMSKALGALLRTSFEISAAQPGGPTDSLPLHRKLLEAVMAGSAPRAERAMLAVIEHARQDMDHMLASRRRPPSLSGPAARLKPPGPVARPKPPGPAARPKPSVPARPGSA
ncbi:MAG: FadR family transcriptional regulator [Burkholderiales bacterium]|nr:FadR family transcriptional regulator [Burkholderiales bacterium]